MPLLTAGPLIALFNAGDRWHATILDLLCNHPTVRLVTTWPVLTEVCALLARRLSNEAALDFLRWIERGALEVDCGDSGTLSAVLFSSSANVSPTCPSTWPMPRWSKLPHG